MYGFTALFVADVTICPAAARPSPVLIPGIIDIAFVATTCPSNPELNDPRPLKSDFFILSKLTSVAMLAPTPTAVAPRGPKLASAYSTL